MPIVPATPVSRTRQQILGAPARLGTISDAGQLGAAVGQLGEVVTGEITAHMQRLKIEADENEAVLAQSQYLDAMTAAHYDGENAYLNRKGNAARGSFADSRAFSNTLMEDISKSLSPDASKLFKSAANQIRANFGTQTIKWMGAQTEQARVEALAAGQSSLQEGFVKARSPEEREEFGVALDAVWDRQSVGSTPKAKQVLVDFGNGKITGTAAVNALNRGDLEDAKAILASERGKHMEESTRIKVQNGIDESEHLTAVQGTTQEALVRFPDPSQASQAEAWIRKNSSGAVQSNSLTNIRKRRSADATAETAQRKAENEAAYSTIENLMEQDRRTGQTSGVDAKIAMVENMASKIQDVSKRARFQEWGTDVYVNGFASVTNKAQYMKLDLMTWQEMQGEDLRQYELERGDYDKLLAKQETSPSNHTNITDMMNNAVFELGLDTSSDEAFNLRQNFKHDIEVLEKRLGPLSQDELDTIMDKLKQGAKDINVRFWPDPAGLSVSAIEEQFNNIPDKDIEDTRDQLALDTNRRPDQIEEREIVSAYRRFLNEQAIGFGRISEPEIVAPAEAAPAPSEEKKRKGSSIIDTGLLQSSLRGFP